MFRAGISLFLLLFLGHDNTAEGQVNVLMMKRKSAAALICGSGGTSHPQTAGGTVDTITGNACTAPSTYDFYNADSCSIYIAVAGGNIACSIYADNGFNQPGVKLCGSGSQAAVANSINTISLAGCPSLSKNTKYWIMWNNNDVNISYGEASPGGVCTSPAGVEMWDSGVTFGTWPSPFDLSNVNGNTGCLWQTYLNLSQGINFTSPPLTMIGNDEPASGIGYSGEYNDGQITSSSANSGEEYYSQGETWMGNAWMGENGSQRYFGYFRIQIPTDVPAGSTVSTATISVYDNGVNGWSSVNDALRIWVEKSPSSPLPVDRTFYPGDSAGTVLSTTSVRWPNSGGLTWTTGGYNTSPSFAAALQEVLDTYGGFVAGDYFTVWIAKDVVTGTNHRVGFKDSIGNATTPPKVNFSFAPPGSPGPASKLVLSGPGNLHTAYCSETRYRVSVQDSSNRAVDVSAPVTVNLTTTGSGVYYSDSNCTSIISSVVIGAGTDSASFYFKNDSSQTQNLTATDNASVLTASTLSNVVSSVRPYTWIGLGGDSLWSNDANWSTGEAPQGNWVTLGERVYFDKNCVLCNATSDITGRTVQIRSLNLINGYTGTLTLGAGNKIEIGNFYNNWQFSYMQTSGTLNGGAGEIYFLGNMIVTGGTITAPAPPGFISTYGNVSVSGVTFNSSSGDWNNAGGDSVVDFGGITLYNLSYTAGWKSYLAGNVTVANNLVISGASVDSDSNTIFLRGNLTVGMDDNNGVNIKFIGPGPQTWSGNFEAPNVEIDSGAGTVTASGSVKLNGSLKYTSGNFVTAGSTITMTPTELTGVPYVDIGANTLENVTMTGDRIITGTMKVGGNMTFNGGSPDQGTIEVAGNVVGTNWWTGGGSTAITLNGTGAQTISRSAGTLPIGAFTINKSSGTASFSTNMPFNNGQSVVVAAGTLDMNTRNITGSPNLSVAAGANLVLAGSQTVTLNSFSSSAGSNVTYNGTTNMSTFNLRLGTSYGGNLTFDGVGGQWRHGNTTVGGNFTITSGSVNSNNNSLTVTGDYTNAGTYTAGSSTIAIAGNFSNTGTYTANTSTVNLNGGNQTISGATTFYNLTKTVATATTLTFPSGTTQTITNTLTLQGAVGQLLSLRSSSGGSQWSIDPQGTRTTSYLDVQDSNNTNGTAISGGGTSVNSGNNTNWTLP